MMKGCFAQQNRTTFRCRLLINLKFHLSPKSGNTKIVAANMQNTIKPQSSFSINAFSKHLKSEEFSSNQFKLVVLSLLSLFIV